MMGTLGLPPPLLNSRFAGKINLSDMKTHRPHGHNSVNRTDYIQTVHGHSPIELSLLIIKSTTVKGNVGPVQCQ